MSWRVNMLGYFVLGHYVFLVAHSFPRATLSANCSLLGKYNVQKGAIVGNTSGFKYWVNFRIFVHVKRLEQSQASENT